MSQHIYEKKNWQRVLKKYPRLKNLATRANVLNSPQKAKEISCKYRNNNSRHTLSAIEQMLAVELKVVEIRERSN